MAAKKFLFSQYSADDSTVSVEVMGIPFRIRRALTIKERAKAQEAAVEITLDREGQPKIGKMDNSAFTVEVCLMALKEWPFEEDDGTPTPINRETVSRLDPSILDKLAANALGYYNEVNREADPFVRKPEGR